MLPFMELFDRDSSYVVHGCWFASKGGEMKSLDFNKIMEFIWFSHDFSKSARACLFEQFECENLKLLYVFVTSDPEIRTKLVVLKDFDMRARRSAHDDFVIFVARDY